MHQNHNIVAKLKEARRVSVPLVSITTADPMATVRMIVDEMKDEKSGGPALVWDAVSGLRNLNKAGKEARDKMLKDTNGDDDTKFQSVVLLTRALSLPERGILFMLAADRFIDSPAAVQAAANLRDEYKASKRMLVMIGAACVWPAELACDVVSLDDPLPDAAALTAIVAECHDAAGLQKTMTDEYKGTTMVRAVEALQGLTAFQAEQVAAMGLKKSGVDVASLWEAKCREQTPGLKVVRERVRFADIGGVETIKGFLGGVLSGKARPNAVVFIDEIEKFLAGATGGGGDSSGVSQDQLGTLLAYMQDTGAVGVLFVGPPGAAKSVVGKAAGTEANVPTIQLDLGAMKGSLVGASEQNLRAALKVVTSVSNGRSLWVATCNKITDLPPELRRRFTLGTFFFDLPSAEERAAIWAIWRGKLEIPAADELPEDTDWTGAEIRQCCDLAWRLGVSLREAAAFVVPVARSAPDQLRRLRGSAGGKFLSASHAGVYYQFAEDGEAAAASAAAKQPRRSLDLA